MTVPISYSRNTDYIYGYPAKDYLGHDYLARTSDESNVHNPHKNKNAYFQFFAEAGSRGGLVSKNRAKFRLNLICYLIRKALRIQPTERKLSALAAAYSIHDEFAIQFEKSPEIYGHARSLGSCERSVDKPYLDYLTRQIRKLVKNGLRLIKSSANMWNPAPELVSA
ncbi:hypothetical protein KKJ06_11230 [Xenorhabdus bovienii]|uniref:hypothetical protein n=1 Tax=Xenorhabdus bovienii TaxID=40576 RepID=UPI00237CF46F|nr:hypothetical protein [Xenorhabdus bovienii]MDE1482159.1 hypothetical protein [Xenorhabdus bovienii]MDE9465621.1 hypothetical protein [Xenorhabdus bovienii]MDE9468835.1 hypothetical protein [Xenorhabdus bovienii]MDE9547571.1 hypothetical protein [Xenorhabdus bovienii]MDE9555992.1 hypothetical protein [Xenorhabdus bovienii]